MGYLTLFKITYSERTEEIRAYALALSDANILNKDGFYYNDEGEVKWYNYENDMLRLSSQFPDVLITVKGQGEDHDMLCKYYDDPKCDVWIQYFKAGKCTEQKRAVIIINFEDFDENNLS